MIKKLRFYYPTHAKIQFKIIVATIIYDFLGVHDVKAYSLYFCLGNKRICIKIS